MTPRVVEVVLPIRLVSEANAHEHWRGRHKRAKAQRWAATIATKSAIRGASVAPPAVVTITRIAPRALDSDNAVGSAKHVRDGVADALGINDRDPRIEWRVAQEKAPPNTYAVCVEIRWSVESCATKGALSMIESAIATGQDSPGPVDRRKQTMKTEKKKATKATKSNRLNATASDALGVRVVDMLKARAGLAAGEIRSVTGMTSSQFQRIIAVLLARGSVCRGGDRRFARYAMTQHDADTASAKARESSAA